MSGNSWVGEHKEELIAAGLIGAMTGGLGLLGAGGAAAAGGLGAAEAGAGAAAGGLAGTTAGAADYALMGLGPEAGAGAGAGGLAGQFAGKGGLPGAWDAMQGPLGRAGNALNTVGKVQGLAGVMQPQPQPMMPMPPPRQSQPTPAPGMQSFTQMYGQPVMDPETRRRMMMQQGGGYGFG